MCASNWASRCQLLDACVIPVLYWLTELTSAAAESCVEEEAWQGTRERQ